MPDPEADFVVDFARADGVVPAFPRPRRIEKRTVSAAEAWIHLVGDDAPQETDLVFILDGDTTLHVDERQLPLRAGAAVLCRGGTAAFARGTGAGWSWARLRFTGAGDVVDALIEGAGHVFDLSRDPATPRQLLQYQRFAGAQPEMGLSEGARLVMALLARLVSCQDGGRSVLSRVVVQAQQYLRDHIADNPSVAQVAEAVGVSAEHLSRCFSRELGTSPQAILIHERMKLACRLLRETTLSIADIATRLGYANANHFSRAFRGHLQTSPSEFRAASSVDLL